MISAALQHDVGWLWARREIRRMHHGPEPRSDRAHPRPTQGTWGCNAKELQAWLIREPHAPAPGGGCMGS